MSKAAGNLHAGLTTLKKNNIPVDLCYLFIFLSFFFPHSPTNGVSLGREYLFGPALKDKELAIPFGATSGARTQL